MDMLGEDSENEQEEEMTQDQRNDGLF
jgi:ankyrin repeat protein